LRAEFFYFPSFCLRFLLPTNLVSFGVFECLSRKCTPLFPAMGGFRKHVALSPPCPLLRAPPPKLAVDRITWPPRPDLLQLFVSPVNAGSPPVILRLHLRAHRSFMSSSSRTLASVFFLVDFLSIKDFFCLFSHLLSVTLTFSLRSSRSRLGLMKWLTPPLPSPGLLPVPSSSVRKFEEGLAKQAPRPAPRATRFSYFSALHLSILTPSKWFL